MSVDPSQLPSEDEPALVVRPDELCAVDASLAAIGRPIPPSRLLEIKKALAVYREANPDGATFDASRGDGGASLPGVPLAVLEASSWGGTRSDAYSG